jgi:hypothetical protein
MILVKLQGGLGNRIFQLSKAETCANGREIVLCEAINERNPHESSYDVQLLLKYRRIAHLPKRYVTIMDGDTVPLTGNVLLDGHFQTWKTELPDIEPVRSQFYFVHVRRGDYLKKSWAVYMDNLKRSATSLDRIGLLPQSDGTFFRSVSTVYG